MSFSPTIPPVRNSSSRTAYILDDEPQVGILVHHVLSACGFAPRQFTSSTPFTAEVEHSPPDLIVLDLALGQSDAIEVIRQLELLSYKGRVLLISGRDEATLVEVTEIGKRHGLTMLSPVRKPFRANDIKSQLTAIDEDSRPENSESRLDANDSGSRGPVHLADALRNDWLELWYQPKVDLKSMTVCGAEALLRARHPEHGILLPAELLPPSGDPLYRPLSEFVIERALANWNLFANREPPLRLAVNVPVSVILADDFVSHVRRFLPIDRGFPGLIIEITEDEMICDPDRVRETAMQLKLSNVLISIDDFGSGYASLSRLNDLPFVEVKIDIAFVRNCSSNRLKHGLCQAIVDVSHRFGASVCAEGVESNDDLRVLLQMGCDTAQGFLFARPMIAEQLAQAPFSHLTGTCQARPQTHATVSRR